MSKTRASKQTPCNVRTVKHYSPVERVTLKFPENLDTPTLNKETQDIIRSLDRLQRSETEWLDGTSIDLGAHCHLARLPGLVYDEIYYTNTWPAGLWNDEHKGAAGLADFQRMKKEITNPVSGVSNFITHMRERQYTIWPTNVGKHWVVIIVRTEPLTAKPDRSLVTHIAVVDPAKHQKTVELVHRRLREFLEYHDFVIADDSRTEIWIPRQRDSWSCGIHVYNVIKVMIQRIKHEVLSEYSSEYSSGIWAPLKRDFQPPKVRLELLGLLAVTAAQALTKSEYNVELSLVLSDGHETDKGRVRKSVRKVGIHGRQQVSQKMLQ